MALKPHTFSNKYNELCGVNTPTSLAGRMFPAKTGCVNHSRSMGLANNKNTCPDDPIIKVFYERKLRTISNHSRWQNQM